MSPITSEQEIRHLALTKMSAVLGPERAQQLLQRILGELRIELQTPQELYCFSEALGRLGGFEAAVGAMLGVSAVMRGASSVRGTKQAAPALPSTRTV